MTAHRVLVAMPLAHDHIDEFADRFEEHDIEYVVPNYNDPMSEADLRELIGGYDAIITGFVGLDEETIKVADQLKVVSRWGIGLDDIDLEAAARRGITVFNTPDAFASEIADVVIAYLVTLTRDLHVVDRAVRAGEWPAPRGVSIRGKVLGIVGVGSIGTAVANRAHAMGMDLLGHDVEPLDEDLVARTGIERVSLETLLEKSFTVSINCPLTPETKGLIGKEELTLLGSEGYLINTARGEIIDEAALVDALRENRLAGAGLDVFETEPLPANHPFTELDNVVLGPHNAGHTVEAVRETTERAVDNVIAGLIGSD